MIDFNEIRKEVAIRHNVLLGNDDPILVTVTLNELVLNQYLSLIAQKYDEANRSLAISLQQQVEQSKKTAGKIITDASSYVSDQVRESIDYSMKQAKNELLTDIKKTMALQNKVHGSISEIDSAKKTAFIATTIAIVSSLIAVASVFLAVIK